jgi:hypothetical protein
VVLSTREHGLVPNTASISAFDYVIVLVKTDNKTMLLDATQRSLTAGILPKRCLNGRGLILKKGTADWINLSSLQPYAMVTSIDAKVLENGHIEGKLSYIRKGYAAVTLRNNAYNANDREEYFKELQKDNPGLILKTKDLSNLDSIYLPTREVYEFQLEGAVEGDGDLLYLSPIIIDRMTANPFRLQNREYPVDYAYPIEETYIVNLALPANYTIEEKPKAEGFTLPENHGKFTYLLNVLNGNSIQLTYKFAINNTVFFKDEYEVLKEFYTQILKKMNEQLVLKKA